MLELVKRKLVTTRKEHECFGCLKEIEKGATAVSVRAKEDDKYKNVHLHMGCNDIFNQHKRDISLYRGCITEDLVKDTKIMCYWCVNEIESGQSMIMGYGKHGAMYFCSEQCRSEEKKCLF